MTLRPESQKGFPLKTRHRDAARVRRHLEVVQKWLIAQLRWQMRLRNLWIDLTRHQICAMLGNRRRR
jgi:hypothetical protein